MSIELYSPKKSHYHNSDCRPFKKFRTLAGIAPSKDLSLDSVLGHIKSFDEYQKLYKHSIENPAQFWGDIAEQFHWNKKWDSDHVSFNTDSREGKIYAEWFKGGETNICYNCLDKHVNDGYGDSKCFIWEGNDPSQHKSMTYKQVLDEVSKLANWLKSQGVKKGDSVAIYVHMVLELPIAMLACARIGAVHSVVFGGFSADALASRILDCKAKVVITATYGMRGKKQIPLKSIADQAINSASKQGHSITSCLVVQNMLENSNGNIQMVQGRDFYYNQSIQNQKAECPCEWVDSEAALFLLYTSGSTGKPKGVLHTTGGYMVFAATTSKYAFALSPGDIYWCTADCGWITGHSYLTYGPLLNRAVSVVFEGLPNYPDFGRYWDVVEKHKVNIMYTAPTAIRGLMREEDSWVTKHDRSSLKVLGSVGEPINPEAWNWYYSLVGEERCPVVDTWWQTETGGHMILPLPNALDKIKPGSASFPFFGVQPAIVDEKGQEMEGECEGYLCIKGCWPGMLRSIYGDYERYQQVYFDAFKGFYFSGDGARRDKDGYYWITGRVDDVINVSGHRIGTAEVESAIDSHFSCSEAAAVGFDHPIKGQGIYVYVILKEGIQETDQLRKELVQAVRTQIGPFASPDQLQFVPGLPKTRSGKIMRRILRKIAANQIDELGDIQTLADPSVVEQIIASRP